MAWPYCAVTLRQSKMMSFQLMHGQQWYIAMTLRVELCKYLCNLRRREVHVRQVA